MRTAHKFSSPQETAARHRRERTVPAEDRTLSRSDCFLSGKPAFEAPVIYFHLSAPAVRTASQVSVPQNDSTCADWNRPEDQIAGKRSENQCFPAALKTSQTVCLQPGNQGRQDSNLCELRDLPGRNCSILFSERHYSFGNPYNFKPDQPQGSASPHRWEDSGPCDRMLSMHLCEKETGCLPASLRSKMGQCR